LKEIDKVGFREITMDWIHDRLDYYKDVKEYAPGTIRKRIETISLIPRVHKTSTIGRRWRCKIRQHLRSTANELCAARPGRGRRNHPAKSCGTPTHDQA